MSETRLIFVYNADSGFYNTLSDIAHKALSPETYKCSLCAITHDLLHEKSEWREFISSLGTETEFLHRDEFIDRYGEKNDGYPVVYIDDGHALRVGIDAHELSGLETVDSLRRSVLSLI